MEAARAATVVAAADRSVVATLLLAVEDVGRVSERGLTQENAEDREHHEPSVHRTRTVPADSGADQARFDLTPHVRGERRLSCEREDAPA
jgi:hypothetical protein